MFKFKLPFILGLFLSLSMAVRSGESDGSCRPVWQLFSEQSLVGKCRFAAAIITLNHRLLPDDFWQQSDGSPASSVTLEEPISPTFLPDSPLPVVNTVAVGMTPDPAIVLPVVVAVPEPAVVPVRSFASLLPKKALNREKREKAAMSGLIARYREGRKAYEPCFDEPGFKRVFGK